ncbi:MAG: thioesterase family protein [Ferruginibacter sp.]
MGRIKIDMPSKVIGTIDIPVRISDINYGNHLGNDSLVSLIHEARVLWLKKHHYTELNAAGAGLIMGDLAVEYLNESFYGDILTISIAAGEISKVSFELFYAIQTSRQEKNIFIAKAKTGMICYDYTNRKVMSIPADLRAKLEG